MSTGQSIYYQDERKKKARRIDLSYLLANSAIVVICTIAVLLLFSRIQSSLQKDNHNYSAISNSTRDVTINLLTMQQSLSNFIHNENEFSLQQIQALSQKLNEQIEPALNSLKNGSWEDTHQIDAIVKLYITWHSTQEEIFTLIEHNNKGEPLQKLIQQNHKRMTSINKQLRAITVLADKKAINIAESFKSKTLQLLKVELATLICFIFSLLAIFYLFQKRITREKQTVSSALAWANKLIDSSPDAMIISNTEGAITQVNHKSEILFGYSKDEFMDLNIAKLMPGRYENHAQKVKQFFGNSSSREMGLGKTLYAVNKLGQEFPVEISLNLAELEGRKVAITIIRDVTEKKRNEATLIHQATHDLLTKLPNRKLINDRLNQAINRANRNHNKFGVLFVDLNGFKKINDNHGHEFGDHLLVSVSNCLRNILRKEDTIGRLGGDEYLIIIPDIVHTESLENVVKKVFAALHSIEHIQGKNIQINASIGISIYPDNGGTADELVRSADLAMYETKKNAISNCYAFFKDTMLQQMAKNYTLETAIKQAFENNEFFVVFQPIFDIKQLKTVGFEALLRWNNPNFSHLGPEDYIPIIEKNNLIHQVGDFVLHQSIKAVKYWQELTDNELYVAVNISPHQLKNPDFPSVIEALLSEYQMSGCHLEVELTERTLIEPSPMIEKALLQLRQLGIGIALDDFGTCYSSMHYLVRFPITCLKIDKSFIHGINDNKGDNVKQVLINTTVSLAQALNLTVTAEGIEHEDQIKYLKEIECNSGQGYFFSKPIPFNEVTALLKSEVEVEVVDITQ